MDVLSSVVQDYLKTDIPAFNVGDTVKVHVKIKEGNRERIQIFEGFVLKTERRNRRDFHCKKNRFRSRRGKDFPDPLSAGRKNRSSKTR